LRIDDDTGPAKRDPERGREPLRAVTPEELQDDGDRCARPDDREHGDPPRAVEDEQAEWRVGPCDERVDARVVESPQPAPPGRSPRRAVVERARAEHRRDARAEDRGRDPGSGAVGHKWPNGREGQCDEEADLVEHAPQPWLLTHHERSLLALVCNT